MIERYLETASILEETEECFLVEENFEDVELDVDRHFSVVETIDEVRRRATGCTVLHRDEAVACIATLRRVDQVYQSSAFRLCKNIQNAQIYTHKFYV